MQFPGQLAVGRLNAISLALVLLKFFTTTGAFPASHVTSRPKLGMNYGIHNLNIVASKQISFLLSDLMALFAAAIHRC